MGAIVDRIYLSIDMDYWHFRPLPIDFLDELFKLSVPIRVVLEHQELLDYLPDFDILINMDTHSDIAENKDDLPELCSGTWINYVTFPNKKELIWIYSHRDCIAGRCNNDGSAGFCNESRDDNPFDPDCERICGWKKTGYRQRKPTKKELDQVIGVGIALSPWWICNQDVNIFIKQFVSWVKKNKTKVSISEEMKDYIRKGKFDGEE